VPEGHTLHRLANALDTAFAGHRVLVSSPQGRFDGAAAQVSGRLVTASVAHGKHLFTTFDNELTWHVHLGLIGKFDVWSRRGDAGDDVRGAVRARIEDADALGDLRGPAACEVLETGEVDAIMSRLGPDPLREDGDPSVAWQRIHRSGKSIAALLMDQSVLSGIGNVYRAEVLFRSRLNPHRPGNKLKKSSWESIWADLRHLMPIGVATGRIDTVHDDHSPEAMDREPRKDDHGGEVYVYRRNGQACHVCGARIRTELLEGRNLFWCGNCQRRG